jgi:putative transposase
MPKLRHYDNLGMARFITFSTYRRRPILLVDEACLALAHEIDHMRKEMRIQLLGYVFMPDHVHLVLFPPANAELGKIIGQLKARSARNIGRVPRIVDDLISFGDEPSVRVWQLRCYDHNCRSPLATREKIEYCHKNPVTRGLVKEPGEWRWSSYNWYQGVSVVPLEIDSIEPV